MSKKNTQKQQSAPVEMMNAKSVQIQYGIELCMVLGFNFFLPSLLQDEEEEHAFATAKPKVKIHEGLERIEVLLDIDLAIGTTKENAVRTASMLTSTLYRVTGLEKTLEKHDDEDFVVIPNLFTLNLFNIALGMSRGVMSTYLAQTPLDGLVLPLIPDNDLIARATDWAAKLKVGIVQRPPSSEETDNIEANVKALAEKEN
jgi:hypothetical protein